MYPEWIINNKNIEKELVNKGKLYRKKECKGTNSKNPECLLAECEGRCFYDKHCQEGLKCMKRNRYPNHVPGCKIGGVDDKPKYNYCYDPSKMSKKTLEIAQKDSEETCTSDEKVKIKDIDYTNYVNSCIQNGSELLFKTVVPLDETNINNSNIHNKKLVRCCNKDSLDINFCSNDKKTFYEAEKLCKDNKLELCSLQQITNNNKKDSKCNIDNDEVWTKEPFCYYNECKNKNKTYSSTNLTFDLDNIENTTKVSTIPSNKNAVRCCSTLGNKINYEQYFNKHTNLENYNNKFTQFNNEYLPFDIAKNKDDFCQIKTSFNKAKSFCESNGLRLCNNNEIKNGFANINCSGNNKKIWSNETNKSCD